MMRLINVQISFNLNDIPFDLCESRRKHYIANRNSTACIHRKAHQRKHFKCLCAALHGFIYFLCVHISIWVLAHCLKSMCFNYPMLGCKQGIMQNEEKKQNASWKSWRNSFKFIGIWALNEFSAWKTCNYKDEQRQTSWETKVYAESTAPSLNCEYVYMCIRLSSDTNHREKETEMWKMCVEKVDAKVEMGIVCTRF